MNISFKLHRTSVAQNEMGFEKCTQIKAIFPKGPVSATILHAMQESNGSALLKLRISTSSLTLNDLTTDTFNLELNLGSSNQDVNEDDAKTFHLVITLW